MAGEPWIQVSYDTTAVVTEDRTLQSDPEDTSSPDVPIPTYDVRKTHYPIVSCDGFRAGRLTPEDFTSLAATRGVDAEIVEVDDSSVFCEITVP